MTDNFAHGCDSAAHVDELQDMFPQLSRTTLLDVLDQLGDGAVDYLLEVCVELESEKDESHCEYDGCSVEDSVGGASRSRGWWDSWQEEEEEARRGTDQRKASMMDVTLLPEAVVVEGDASSTRSSGSGSRRSEADVWTALDPAEFRPRSNKERLDTEFGVSQLLFGSTRGGDRNGWNAIEDGAPQLQDWGIPCGPPTEMGAAPGNSSSDYESPVSDTSSNPEEVELGSQVLRFLGDVFANSELTKESIRNALDSTGGDVNAALEKLWELRDGVSSEAHTVKSSETEKLGKPERFDEDFPALQSAVNVTVGKNARLVVGTTRSATKVGLGLGLGLGNETELQSSHWRQGAEVDPTDGSPSGVAQRQWTSTTANSSLHRKARGLQLRFGNAPKFEVVLDLLRDAKEEVETVARHLRESGFTEADYARKLVTASAEASSRHHPGIRTVKLQDNRGKSQEQFQGLYNKEREMATVYGEKRTLSFKQAAEAWKNGHEELAKNLELQGLRYARLAKDEHHLASQRIFEQRNATIVNIMSIDLHGMHVAEALKKVNQYLTQEKKHMDALPTKKTFRFITGRGRHSPEKVSKLYIALHRFFDKHGIRYTTGPGYLDVPLEDEMLS